jgi:hypothetical protein
MSKSVLIVSLFLLIAGPAWSAVSTSAQPRPAAANKGKAGAQAAVTKNQKPRKASASTAKPTQNTVTLTMSTSLRELPKSPKYVAPSPPAASPTPAPTLAVYHPPYAPAWQRPLNNPYLMQQTLPRTGVSLPVPNQAAPASPWQGPGQPLSNFSLPNIPILPGNGRSIFPTIKTVYPTGDKPLVVVSFKCPTEMIGVTPPNIKIMHDMVTFGMDSINRTDLLAFNIQQVCQ